MLEIKKNLRLSTEDFQFIAHTDMAVLMIKQQYVCYGSHKEIEELVQCLDKSAQGAWHLFHKDRGPEVVCSILYLHQKKDVKLLQKFEINIKS